MPALRQQVSSTPFTLAIVGEGPYRRELEALLPDAIFTGILTGRDLGVAYASADLFVFPSTTDTYGNVVVEAMAAGLPVAVSDIGGPARAGEDLPDGARAARARRRGVDRRAFPEMLAHLPPAAERQLIAHQAGGERQWATAFAKFWADGLR